jgi:hypothetical protein
LREIESFFGLSTILDIGYWILFPFVISSFEPSPTISKKKSCARQLLVGHIRLMTPQWEVCLAGVRVRMDIIMDIMLGRTV